MCQYDDEEDEDDDRPRKKKKKKEGFILDEAEVINNRLDHLPGDGG
jgi:hypothetical protein